MNMPLFAMLLFLAVVLGAVAEQPSSACAADIGDGEADEACMLENLFLLQSKLDLRGSAPLSRSNASQGSAANASSAETAESPAAGAAGANASAGSVMVQSTDPDAEVWLKAHNKFRCMHGTQDLVWDDAVAASAQSYADSMTSPGIHSDSYRLVPPHGPAAENLNAQPLENSEKDIKQAVRIWYDEVENCAELPGCETSTSGVTGHFTAMIWKGATKMGCGIAEHPESGWRYYVCRYKDEDTLTCGTPNIDGCYRDNVKRKKKTPDQCKWRR